MTRFADGAFGHAQGPEVFGKEGQVMEKDPDRWKKLCVTVVELAGILVLALEFTIQTVIYSFGYALSGPEISVKDLWVVLPGALSSILLMCLFSCMQPDKVWDYQRNQKPHRYVFWLYGVSVFLYIFNLFITVTGSSLSGYIFLFLIFEGGGALPLYIYCAQFLFPPRPRLRFISSLLVIPVCVLWIGLLLLLAFKWLGS